MVLTTKQREAVLFAMFGIENEIEHLKYLLIGMTENQDFIKGQLKLRQEHFIAMKEIFEGRNDEQ